VLLSVCLNPAVDVTYQVASTVVPGSSHRVTRVSERAGGKGVNVARVLRQLGAPGRVLALVGGATGEVVRSGLSAAGIEADLVEVGEPTRRTVTVVDPLDATVFNEPGPTLTSADWTALVQRFRSHLDVAKLVVLSGSLPPGVPVDAYRILTELGHAAGIPVIVDAEGGPLELALAAKPYLVKPNLAEAQSLLGSFGRISSLGGSSPSRSEIVAAGWRIQALGARNVVVSCGRDGLVAVTEDGDWHAVSAEMLTGNPTGAGDALVAALALGTVAGHPWPQRLRDGVSMSAAAVASPVAGEIDLAVRARLEPQVRVTRLTSISRPTRTEKLER
jgi:tagatose 6-phosphate kinase